MKNIKIILVAVILVLVFFSCADPGEPGDSGETTYDLTGTDWNDGFNTIHFNSNTEYTFTGGDDGLCVVNASEVTFTSGSLNGNTDSFTDDDDSNNTNDIYVLSLNSTFNKE